MKISSGVSFKGFKFTGSKKNLKNQLEKILNSRNEIIRSLSKSYKDSYTKKTISNLKKYSDISLIGMGGSSLGSRSIYNFLNEKIKKRFIFFDNLSSMKNKNDMKKNKRLNLIVSKSGNTLETITNVNLYIKKKHKNIFITENKDSYLNNLAQKLKADIVSHNNFIGGRFSVLSEVGMLPAELMGLNPIKFRQLNNLIKDKNFIKSLISNVSNTISLINKKKTNSVILNYDEKSSDLFFWYQQLIAESLGKKGKGILPVVSTMPKDNHSLLQLYLDGTKNNFFTFFYVKEKFTKKINDYGMRAQFKFLKGKSIEDIKYAQYQATQNVFKKKGLPFRSFLINKRDEETLGFLFTFFILETLLLAKAIKVEAFNQPAVELIKVETSKIIF
tara:strand:- start:1009 stop:2172 length:1164 start_codon:yes stop_codon:yes gene_type:complete